MKFSVLGSGSKGNSVYIETGKTAILIDAGFSGKELKKRLALIDRSVDFLQGICVTHEHNDHISGVGVLSRQCKLPVFANLGTYSASETKLGKLFEMQEFETGDEFIIGDLTVRSFRVSHDTADPVGFVVSDGKRSLGYCTDTGRVSHLIEQRLRGCQGLVLEFNHNLEMLKRGPYPLPLQQRVRSNLGHLSNDDAAAFLSGLIAPSLENVILAHLSEVNNRPELALGAVREQVAQPGETRFAIASQTAPTLLVNV